ncbi:hypothetical protein BEH94_03240 [Candidatus Altiarchaeales archaeon WOR_SM1_SCG]|nr:hypothetical protein BEH94_03240 [Candidatus Altiarchaeales archaeon WOR_SM1_SCG]
MKGLLLRVGIDNGFGGCLAPIYKDGSFEYIPIHAIEPTTEKEVYATMEGIKNKKGIKNKIVDFVPEKIKYSHPHYDPEFTTFTYGDPTEPKRNQLAKLDTGDLLIFYAGLMHYVKPKDGKKWYKAKNRKLKSRLFIIGYFEVEKVYDFNEIPMSEWKTIFKKVSENAHAKTYFRLEELKIEYSNKKLIIVKGRESDESKLFTKAIPLGDGSNKLCGGLERIFGYPKTKSLTRAICRWIDKDHIHKVKEFLENEGKL